MFYGVLTPGGDPLGVQDDKLSHPAIVRHWNKSYRNRIYSMIPTHNQLFVGVNKVPDPTIVRHWNKSYRKKISSKISTQSKLCGVFLLCVFTF